MDEQESKRLEDLLRSVEKEELEESRAADEEREILCRKLFDNDNLNENINLEEEEIERKGFEQSQEEIEESNHDTVSEMSLKEINN